MKNTIVALATPFGRSGIAVVRLSGTNALSIVRHLTGDENFNPEPRLAALKKIYSYESAEILDETLITYFQSPQSFTGEDVIEISCHGSPIIVREIIDSCLKLDARMAEAGEFSLRALANGRMSLSQAEAIRDLIDAQTAAAARQSIRQLRGELSNQIQPLKNDLLDIIVVLESSLEFVEDDLPDFQAEDIKNRLTEIAEKTGRMASTFQSGKLLREGLKIALVGRPNVGKSSIFNALVGLDRAIVTEIAGTTRDQLHEKIVVNNIPISLIDTAGLRETTDIVESIGVERSRRAIVDADLTVAIFDGSQKLTFEDQDILRQIKDLKHIVVINKIDLPGNESRKNLEIAENFISVSAKTSEGLNILQNALVEPFTPQDVETSGFLVSDARHHDLLLRTMVEIENSVILLDQKFSEEIILSGLHSALHFLGQITGETTTEDMLARIFSTFCIGK